MRRILIAVFAFSLALAGCKGKEAEKADIAKNLDEKGTVDLMNEAAKDEYTAPEDGKLTDAQVRMYLKVREHEKKIAQVAKEQLQQHSKKAEQKGDKSLAGMMEGFKALGSAADVLTADIRAAKELGYNTQEYLWVKGQILAASTAAMAEKMNQAMTANMNSSFAQIQKAHDEATDPATKKMYADMLAGMQQSQSEMQQQQQADADPATAYNRQLLAKYESELKAWEAEWSKWEDKPGQAAEAVQQFEKNVQDAGKQQQ